MARQKVTVSRHQDTSKGLNKELENAIQSLFFKDAIRLDPNGVNRLVMIGAGSSMIGRVDGQWGPTPNGPFFGPGGEPNTNIDGFPKYACLIGAINAEGAVVAPFVADDPQDGWEVDNPQGFPVWAIAIANAPDPGSIDNPANPMRATIGVLITVLQGPLPETKDVNVNTCSVNPSTVALGDQAILTVTLDAPAPSGGITVIVDTNFSGDDDLKDTPQAIGIEQGQSTGQFTLQTQDVDASGNPILNPSTQITFIAHITPVAEPGDKAATLNITSGKHRNK